ncbi:MAG: NADH-quinone oxidoreductase subunit C [Thermodesulfobacteriota bacterium]|nr:NADH-quinone oxidoreductase subunit C [Thermodesulfobacteriota bacterium]
MNRSKLIRFQHGTCIPLCELPRLDFATFRESLLEEVTNHARVASFFGHPSADGLELYAILAHDWQGELALLHTRVGDSYPSLTPDCPQLHLFERELTEQYGVRPEGHPWLKPVRFHNPWVDTSDIWGRDTKQHPIPGDMDFYRVEGEEVHEVAVGPVHAGVIEPGHFRFQCHGEQVMHLEISLGFQHRAIEQMLIGGPHPANIYQIEAAAGDTTIGHTTAYSKVLESLAECDGLPRASTIRAIALELERLANHVGDIGGLATDIGFLPTASFCGRLRGDYLNLAAELCGSRFGRGLVRPGGVLFDLNNALVDKIIQRLEVLEPETRGAIELCFDNPSVLARFEGVGVVSTDDAETLGLVGIAAKACGLVRDARLHHPFASGAIKFDTPVIETDGDVCARGNVRRREIYASHELLRDTLKQLPTGDIYSPPKALAPDSLAVALCEGWRGELIHAAITDGNGKIARYKIVDPSFHNWSALALSLRNEQISDFPLCNKSFNLSYCGFDL